MKLLQIEDVKKIAGGKNANDFYEEIVKPAVIGGGAVIGGFGGATAGAIIIYGIEGFVQIAPDVMISLEQLNRLTEAELQRILNDPYSFPD